MESLLKSSVFGQPLVKIPDSLCLKNGIVAQIVSIWSAFSQDTRFSLFKEWNCCSNRQYLVSLQSRYQILFIQKIESLFKSLVFGQPLVNFCFKMFYRQTSFSANVRNSQKSFPDSQIPAAQQYIFDFIKPLFQIPAKTENLAKILILYAIK